MASCTPTYNFQTYLFYSKDRTLHRVKIELEVMSIKVPVLPQKTRTEA